MSIFLSVVLLAASAATDAPSCADVEGWNAGRRGKTAAEACTAEGYGEAFRLGEALADLNTRRAALDARIAEGGGDVGALRRQQRQIDVDIEAIHGIATLRGWPVQTLSEDATKENTQ